MPIIAVQVHTFTNMQQNTRTHLLRAGIPAYSFKERQAGFQVWHAELNEGEVQIIWHTFAPDDDTAAQREGLNACASVLQEHNWVRLDMPGMYTEVYRPTLRMLHNLSWLK